MHFGEPKLLTGLKLCCMAEFCAGGLGLITQIRLIGVTISLLLSVILALPALEKQENVSVMT